MTVYDPRTSPTSTRSTSSHVTSPETLRRNSYRQSISRIESGSYSGNYSALGPVVKKGRYAGDRAYGRYQVMGKNIPEWTRQATGKVATVQEFLRNPELQNKVFDYRFNKAIAQHGTAADAASVWFSGQPLSNKAAQQRTDGYTAVSDYVAKFNRNMRAVGGQEELPPEQQQQQQQPQTETEIKRQKQLLPVGGVGLFGNVGAVEALNSALDDQHNSLLSNLG